MNDQPHLKRLSAASEDMLREIVREAEVHLASQQAVALAADQRAMTLTGFLTATVVVMVGAGASFALAAEPNKALAIICILVATALLLAAGIAVLSAAPSKFDFAGSSPTDWLDDIDAGLTLKDAMAAQCVNYSEMTDDNHVRMAKNGRTLWWSIQITLGAIALGGLAFVIALFTS